MLVCVPQPARNVHSHPHLRRPRILAGAEAAVEGTVCVVAERDGTDPKAAGPSSAVAAGGGQPGDGSGAGVAAGERVKKITLALAFQI